MLIPFLTSLFGACALLLVSGNAWAEVRCTHRHPVTGVCLIQVDRTRFRKDSMMKRLAACLTASLVALTACTPSDPEPTVPVMPPPPPSVATPAPSSQPLPDTPPPTPPVASSPSASHAPTYVPVYQGALPTAGADSQAIVAGWQKYWLVYEMFSADPFGYTDFSETQLVTTGERQTRIIQAIGELRDKRLKVVGHQVLRDIQLSDLAKGPDGSRQASISYCADGSNQMLVNVDTGEQVAFPGPTTFTETITMVEGADGVWRVGGIENQPAKC